MSELISSKDVLIALANGKEAEYYDENFEGWVSVDMTLHHRRKFRLKPRTITINCIDYPKPMSIGWGDPDKTRINIGFNSEGEAEEFFNKFRGFV